MRDPRASEPFSPQERAVLLARADDTSELLGRLCRVLMYCGAHITVITGGFSQETDRPAGVIRFTRRHPLTSRAIDGGYLYWRRPKNQKGVGVPIKREMLPWLADFLDAPKPGAHRVQVLLRELGGHCGFHVNPLRFRHTCACILYHEFHIDGPTVCRMLGVTPSVLAIYIALPWWEVADKMRAGGW